MHIFLCAIVEGPSSEATSASADDALSMLRNLARAHLSSPPRSLDHQVKGSVHVLAPADVYMQACALAFACAGRYVQ
jgi:hypothetical protein